MTEKDLWNKLRKTLDRKEFMTYRIESPTHVGLPDAQIIYDGYLFMIELKVARGNEKIKIRDSQKVFASQLAMHGFHDYFVIVGKGGEFSYIPTDVLIDTFDFDWRWSDIEELARPVTQFADFLRKRAEVSCQVDYSLRQ